MALIECEECGKEYSEFADKCPHCGCPNPEVEKKEARDKLWSLAGAAGIVIVIFWAMSRLFDCSGDTSSDYTPTYQPVNKYADISKDSLQRLYSKTRAETDSLDKEVQKAIKTLSADRDEISGSTTYRSRKFKHYTNRNGVELTLYQPVFMGKIYLNIHLSSLYDISQIMEQSRVIFFVNDDESRFVLTLDPDDVKDGGSDGNWNNYQYYHDVVEPNSELYQFLGKIASAKKATIRYIVGDTKSDFTVSSAQKSAMREVLAVMESVNKYNQAMDDIIEIQKAMTI